MKVKQIYINDAELKYLINTRNKINEKVENNSNYVTKENEVMIFPVFETLKDESDNETISKKEIYYLITRNIFPKGGLLQMNKDINFEKENSYDYLNIYYFMR